MHALKRFLFFFGFLIEDGWKDGWKIEKVIFDFVNGKVIKLFD